MEEKSWIIFQVDGRNFFMMCTSSSEQILDGYDEFQLSGVNSIKANQRVNTPMLIPANISWGGIFP